MAATVFASAPTLPGKAASCSSHAETTAEEALLPVLSNDWVNDEYKHMVVVGTPKTLAAKPGQFFNILCPSPDDGELWLRRPQSIYVVDKPQGRLEFLYKVAGRGTKGMATIEPGSEINVVGPLGEGYFEIPDGAKNIVVLGRGVGLATLAPISQLAAETGIGVTALLSARSPELAMGADLFSKVGTVVKLLDTDGTSDVANVEAVLNRLIAEKKADAFYTCGSNRLMNLMKKLGKQHNIPGQVAMEQVMACGLGPCYVCIRAFETADGKKDLRRVCYDGPVFDLQEAVAW
jgi:dihydroorotate dehydrogenase electron transfer subunit